MVKMDMITRKGDIAFVISSDWKGKRSNYPTAQRG
jgi:hypothetical protein